MEDNVNAYINKKLYLPPKRSYNKDYVNPKIALLMVGNSGSGKTGTKEKCCKNYPVKFINIDPDEFLEHFYENDRQHYPKVFKHARALLAKTIEQGRSFVLDGTGVDLFKNIKRFYDEGYYVSLCINLLDKETCKSRAKSRQSVTGREPDVKFIDIADQKIRRNIKLYIESEYVDDAFVFLNECDGRRRLICTKKFGNCTFDKINLLF